MKKDRIILIGAGLIALETIRVLQQQHPGCEVVVRTPDEHEQAEKQKKTFERPPISFINPYDGDFVPEFKSPKFQSNGGPMGAIEKKRRRISLIHSHTKKFNMIFKTKKQQERYNSNVPNGIPKWIRCYDNGGKTADRYTVVFTKKAITNSRNDRWFMYLGMSGSPFHPQGIGQHGESNHQPVDRPTYGHLGKKIKFEDLPEDCRKLVVRDYLELWDFTDDEGNILN